MEIDKLRSKDAKPIILAGMFIHTRMDWKVIINHPSVPQQVNRMSIKNV
jgi:hypothetical protein